MNDWQLWEVFVRARSGLAHKHIGSVRAVDGAMALEHARDIYGRRNEAASLWVVPASMIVASDPDEQAALFDASVKDFRHPTFYKTPAGVDHL